MSVTETLSATAARRILTLRDLTDPCQGHHAIQCLIDDLARAVGGPDTTLWVRHANPVVAVSDNYDRLGYEPDAAARDARYSRYLTDGLMLRTHTSSMIPLALEQLAGSGHDDVTVLCPGMVYRRDVIDRQHVGEPHQLDLWRIRVPAAGPLNEDELDELVDRIIAAVLPGRRWRTIPAEHPYTLAGRQIDVEDGDDWVEVGECGLAHPGVLGDAGLPTTASGLASGWGLDRMLMLRKRIDDIRLLRSVDARVASQMHDLEPYQPVSSMPPAIRDLSVAMHEEPDPELLGDRIRNALGEAAADIESVHVLETSSGHHLPPQALDRLGMQRGQHNVLIRVVLRALDRTLTAEEANRLRDHIYAEVHEGTVHQWASAHPPSRPHPSARRVPRATP